MVTARRTDAAQITFPGRTVFDIAVSDSSLIELDYSPSGSFITLIEPESDQTLVFDINRDTGTRSEIGRFGPIGETVTSARTSSGEAVVISGVELGLGVLHTGDSDIQLLAIPSDGPVLDGPVEAGPLHVSPLGATIVSPICGLTTCVTRVVRTEGWRVDVVAAPFIPHATTDDFVLGYPSLDDRRWHLLDLSSGSMSPVAPEIAGAYDGHPRADGTFIAYGASSWNPDVPPVHRPVVEIDPATGDTVLLVDQDPETWGHLETRWTSRDWVLIGDRSGHGFTIYDARTGQGIAFQLEGSHIVVP